MTSEIKVDTISENTSANGVTIDGLTIKDGNIIGDVALAGTTPTFTVGDGGAEDAALIFDGNALDYYIALDDSADNLIIGSGSTVGSNSLITIDSDGDLSLDIAGDILLDAGGADIRMISGGTDYCKFTKDGNNTVIKAQVSDGDLILRGSDSGSQIDALTLDMSEAGRANFNNDIGLSDNRAVRLGSGDDAAIYNDGSNTYIKNATSNQDIIFQGNDDGSAGTTALTLDMSAAGAATFNAGITAQAASTITTADNTDTLSLISTDADANAGPNLRLYRNTSSPADADTIGVVEFEGRNDNSEDVIYSQMRTVVNDVSDGTEDGQIDIKIMNGGSLNMVASFKGTETVINDASIDHDFRVESNGNANMLFVDGGSNLVGIGADPDLGAGLHIKTADSGASVNSGFDELVIEGSGNSGISILSGNTSGGAIIFGDDGDNDIGNIFYDHNVNDMVFNVAATEMLRIDSDNNNLATGGETAGDVGAFGLCLNQGTADGNILTFKSSDVAHGITGSAETDTFVKFSKHSATNGGLSILALSEASETIKLNANPTSALTDQNTSTLGAHTISVSKKSGTGTGSFDGTGNILSIANHTTTRFHFRGDGNFYADAGSNTFDEFEDAHLVRAYDLSHGKGVINSKFDEYVKYNHEKLAELDLVGRENNGEPNHFINVTGFQRLHNGAIWQQYEKHQRLAEAVYEMAKETLGADKADAILKKHDIKLLN